MRRAKGEGAICRRKDGLWVARYVAAGKRRYIYGKTKKAVADKLRELVEEVVDHESPDRRLGADTSSLHGVVSVLVPLSTILSTALVPRVAVFSMASSAVVSFVLSPCV